jgi:hypothetical protein
VNTAAKLSLASKISSLAEDEVEFGGAPAEAPAILHSLRREYPEFDKFMTQKFTRLPVTQQQALLALIQAARAHEFDALLAAWSADPTVVLHTRVQAMMVQESLGLPVDVAYHRALTQAEHMRQALETGASEPLTETGLLQAPWDSLVGSLPLELVLQVARELVSSQPAVALAMLQAVGANLPDHARTAWIDSVAAIPLAGSATLLQAMLSDVSSKALQKTIKKALHRLKVQGVVVHETPGARVVVGAGTHRLERCLSSFVDGNGDRMLLMVRTKAGGYNIAYLILNYGLGIRHAMGLQVTRRELPDLLEKAQDRAPLIDLDPAYCQYQVALAHQMNLETGTPVPEEFFLLRDIIGETETTFDQALIYTELTPADLEAAKAYESHAEDLLGLAEFAGWTLPASVVQKYGDELQEIESSQIVVSPTMQRERMNQVYERAMEDVLSERARRIMRLRLEEMAYYLWHTDRHLQALWAVAAARSLLQDNPQRLRHNPFAGALLERSLDSAKKRTSGRIITPFSRPSSAPSSAGSEAPRLII